MTREEKIIQSFRDLAAHHYLYADNLSSREKSKSVIALEWTALLVALHLSRGGHAIPEVIKSHVVADRHIELLQNIERSD